MKAERRIPAASCNIRLNCWGSLAVLRPTYFPCGGPKKRHAPNEWQSRGALGTWWRPAMPLAFFSVFVGFAVGFPSDPPKASFS